MSSGTSLPPESPAVFRRHDFLRCDPSETSNLPTAARDWINAGRPLIVRRPCVSACGDFVCAGIALPPSMGKHRIALEIPRASIRSVFPPPTLEECLQPCPLRTAFEQLLEICGAENLRAFGSYAWEFLTGLEYVSPASDLDVLLSIDSISEWRKALGILSSWNPPEDRRVDLEIILRGDVSFLWKEYSGAGDRLLFKSNSTVWMGKKSDIDALL